MNEDEKCVHNIAFYASHNHVDEIIFYTNDLDCLKYVTPRNYLFPIYIWLQWYFVLMYWLQNLTHHIHSILNCTNLNDHMWIWYYDTYLWNFISVSTTISNKNIERHTAHTIVSRPNPKQWQMGHTSDLIMIMRYSTRILTIIIR